MEVRGLPRSWIVGLVIVAAGCTPGTYREQIDTIAYDIIAREREAALGKPEPFTIDRPSNTLRERLFIEHDLPYSDPVSLSAENVAPYEAWPDESYLEPNVLKVQTPPWRVEGGLELTLLHALQVGARNSREYQTQKELVFLAALDLDLERNEFTNFWFLFSDGEITRDLRVDPLLTGVRSTTQGTLTRKLKQGTSFVVNLGLDLVKLLTQDKSSSLAFFGDATISVPLMRGSGQLVVTEPLTQAQRDVTYAIFTFERFKRQFAVRVATNYLGVLSMLDQVRNAEENYRRLIGSTRRARRMASAGRLPEIQVDQSEQDELRARNRWILAVQAYERDLDDFRILLGLPTDANVRLDDSELEKLAQVVQLTEPVDEDESVLPGADDEIILEPPTQADAGPFELPEDEAVAIAFENRLDLRIALGQIYDSQRGVMVAADALRADLTLLGSVVAGERRTLAGTSRSDTGLRLDRARYSALLSVDLPFERVPERNFYRGSLIDFERAVRAAQELEDTIKRDIRDDLRTLLAARESLRIQKEAVEVAQRRVESTDLFLRAGRAEVRDVLEAQEDLIGAQNSLTAARVQYRVSELELQRDLDVLDVDHQGIWREFKPETSTP